MCKTAKPAVCEVDGCSGTYRIARHKATGLYICHACYARYKRKGHFGYTKPETIAECPHCGHVKNLWLQGETGQRVCGACYQHYRRRGTYERKFIKRRKGQKPPPVCPRCRERNATMLTDAGWRCARCQKYRTRTGRERPRVTRVTREKVCKCCGRNTEMQNNAYSYCYMCRSYRERNGNWPPPEHIAKCAPHGWCECGKPATQQVDLRTGGILVVPTKHGTADYLTETREEYTEWMCDECAGYEAEMAQVGGNEPRPSALIARA